MTAWEWITGGAAAVALAAALGAWVQALRLERRLAGEARAAAAARRDLAAVCATLAALGDRVLALEARIEELAEAQEMLRTREPGDGVYAQAVRLAARGGAGVEELMAQCGLSRGEAELIVRLHGRIAADA
ncbi:DUF2802 domain-containing protein [Inmirania thermothiophila]|uniref:Uncharacterized protein DUF2802 n=1 Tax=Inmirania thermothiophila TaxID=1750597 RepID=A0A3N1Y8T4_9GAMM|nr:DUF2802 domain-containing protein [Inmirania thermothiophila]ROR34951.1 uncharacterized protein DUF2802 [Inmirania thermothiophila]